MSISNITTESGKENWDLFCRNLTLPEGGKILIGDREIDSIGSWQPAVIGFLSAPPIGPSEGDRYIISATATGIWTGREDDIAEWTGTAWVYTTPEDGYTTVNQTDNLVYIYDTMWNPIGVTSDLQSSYDLSTSPQIVTSDLRGELTLRRGTTSDTDNVLKVENGAGDEKFSVLGDGTLKVEKLTELNSSGTGILVEVNDARPFTVQGTSGNSNVSFEVQDNGGTPNFTVAGTGQVTARNIVLGPVTAEISSETDGNQLDIYGGVSGSGPHIRLYGPSSGSNSNRMRLEGDRIDFRNLTGTRLLFLDMVNQNVDSSIPIEGTSILGRVPANGLDVEDINFKGRVMSTSESTGIRIQSNSVTGTDIILACRDSTESNVMTVNNDGTMKVDQIIGVSGLGGVTIESVLIDNNNIEGVNSIESSTGPGGTVDFYGDVNLLELSPAYKINGTNVLTDTALGSGVLDSSLTTVGTLTVLDLGGDLTMNSNDVVGANNIDANRIDVDDITINDNSITSATANLDLFAPNGDVHSNRRFQTLLDIWIRGKSSIGAQGSYLQWNRNLLGKSYLVNQRGSGLGGISFGSSTTSDVYTEYGSFAANGDFSVGNITLGGNILSTSSGDLEIRSASGVVQVQDTLSFNPDTSDILFGSLASGPRIDYDNSGTRLIFNVDTGDSFQFQVNNITVGEVTSTEVTVPKITVDSNITLDTNSLSTSSGDINVEPAGNFKVNLTDGTTYDTFSIETLGTGSKMTLQNPAETKDITFTVNTASNSAVLTTSCDIWSISDRVEMYGISENLANGLNVEITPSGELFVVTSSKRFKENIVDTKYGLDSVMKMRPVEYEYINRNGHKSVGLIAEELIDIVPEAISFDKDLKTPKGIDYLKLVPICIKAIQELKSSGGDQLDLKSMTEQIISLKEENSALVKKMNTLELQVQNLMKRL